MRRSLTQPLVCLILVLSLLAATGDVRAEDVYPSEDVTAGSMVFDLAFVRPVGIFSTVFGAAAWVVALPFTLPTGSVDEAGEMLVFQPARYTFKRPLGQLDDDPMAEY